MSERIIVCKQGSLFFDMISPLFNGKVDALYFSEEAISKKDNKQALAFLLASNLDLAAEAQDGMQMLRDAVQYVFGSDDIFASVTQQSIVESILANTDKDGNVDQDVMQGKTFDLIVNKYLDVAYITVDSFLSKLSQLDKAETDVMLNGEENDHE